MSTETPKKAPTGLGWEVKEFRNGDGTLKDCFVAAPRSEGMAYGLEVLGDDYTGYGDVEGKLKHCQMIVAWANASSPVSAEPTDDEIIDIAVEPLGIDCDRMPYGIVVFARALLSRYSSAPAATQPGLTQQTLDDVMAGIPARDAEIEALRKQVKTLQAQLVDISPEIQGTPVDESPNLQSQQKPVSGADGLADFPTHGMSLGQRIAYVGGRENAQGYVEFGSPMAVHALIQHVLRDFHRQGRVNLTPAKQTTDPLQGAADWLVRDCGVSDPAGLANRLGIGYNRASRLVDAARKEQA